MIDPYQLRKEVRNFLIAMEPRVPYSKEAEDLLLMTAAHESLLGTYLRQTRGPALGIYQMEPDTFRDLKVNFLSFRPPLKSLLTDSFVNWSSPEEMAWNLRAATVAARLQYRRVPEPLPKSLKGLAHYAKTHWNTELGKATAEDYLNAYKEAYK